ncbi:biotin-dependent carboxyltransferase family protein [Phaeobacter sp. HF9A]|uniref:5-oxoprolinase subunit C family protein n=1 Tax=Phaeobacter sp. HF9A TaxID=2721561 RepID=UPI00143121DB|nr:urea amidolyase [Phaeobacter sp. HF9A]NIZ14628.1 urea amidolyase [Phaeobacter sp. HF9A]
MSRALTVLQAGPGLTVQDMGRSGYLVYGLSAGGAADKLALAEGAALLGQDPELAALELAGLGGRFQASEDMRIALTGAPMSAALDDGTALRWNASHLLPKGAVLTIGAVRAGSYGYLHLGGGIATPPLLGARSAHLVSGLGARVQAGDVLPIGTDRGGAVNMALEPEPRLDGGTLRMLPSLQTGLFGAAELARFQDTVFTRDSRANRMGVRLLPEGAGFALDGGLSVLSEVIAPGDIQVTGDGTPYVLMSECQTTGGYPRIGSVLPSDLPRVAQAQAGTTFRFALVSLPEAVEIERRVAEARARLPGQLRPLLRDPATLRDLLSYQLVSGVTAGDDLDFEN